MKAVAYLRVSTLDQSLDRQHDDIKKFALNNDLELERVFEDKISGSKTKTDDREGFNEMEKYIDSNKHIKHILVLEVSRLGRKNNDIQNIVEKYTEKGINIHIQDLNIKTLDELGNRSFASEMMISMLGVMAANESRLLSSRISSGKMSRAKKNLAFGGKIIGYKKGEDGTPIIDEDQSPMIERIFELASEGLGMRNISAILESEFNRKFRIGTLQGIIRNPFHKGERTYKDLVLNVPAIVTKEIWKKANDSIDSRKKFGSRTNVNVNIVQGKIKCGCCGGVMYQKVIPDGRLNLFVCNNNSCSNSINRPWLFRMIRKIVERHATKTKDEQIRYRLKLKISAINARIEINTKKINKLEARKKRARDLYVDDDLSKEEYEEIKSEASERINKLNNENLRSTEKINNLNNDLSQEINHFNENLEIFKTEIQDIIKHVIIGKENVIINIFGWREYDLFKPNSTKLGWEARKPENQRYLNEKLPLRHPITDEVLEEMVDEYLEDNYFDKVDRYLNSQNPNKLNDIN